MYAANGVSEVNTGKVVVKAIKRRYYQEFDLDGRLRRKEVEEAISEADNFEGRSVSGYRTVDKQYLIVYGSTLIYLEDQETGDYYFDTSYYGHGVSNIQGMIRKHLNQYSPEEKSMLKTLRDT